MNRFSRVARLLAVPLLFLVMLAPADATLLTAGSPLEFDFDFTADLPFNAARIDAAWTPALVPGRAFGIDFYDQPGAVDFLGGASLSGGGSSTFNLVSAPGIADGIFSIVVSVSTGSVDVTSLVLQLGNLNLQTDVFTPLAPDVSRTLIPAVAVPEPATWGLLAMALLAFAPVAARRAARRGQSSGTISPTM
ncbi:MAG TPA: PEP-CTERM sorting domain-containing protein [Casimicrobiaceae bacterium]|nr:PEP-CTERM sorting domain-containing protein [Casimicrobiaceae bacterium]